MSLFEGFRGFSLLQRAEIETRKGMMAEYYISDTMAQEFKTCSADNFLNIQVKRIEVYEKELDQDLPWYKTLVATLSKIPLSHSFIYIEAEDNIFITIDFYKGNRVTERLAKSKEQVLYSHVSSKRGSSKLTTSKMFQVKSYCGAMEINVGDLRKVKEEAVSQDDYSQFRNNCSDYCKRFMNIIYERYVNI